MTPFQMRNLLTAVLGEVLKPILDRLAAIEAKLGIPKKGKE